MTVLVEITQARRYRGEYESRKDKILKVRVQRHQGLYGTSKCVQKWDLLMESAVLPVETHTCVLPLERDSWLQLVSNQQLENEPPQFEDIWPGVCNLL